MAWSSLDPSSRIQVILDLIGGPKYRAEMAAASGQTAALGRATKSASAATAALTHRTFLQNQVMFTARRLLFYTTLGMIGLGIAAIRMGFQYQSALQTSQVALQPVIRDQRVLNRELDKLYSIAALSPFLFKDTVVAFRQMYAAFRPLGFSIDFTNKTIQSLVDALSYAGKTSPAALNRVSVALQHMAFLGRPMGQTILQLARDGLPIYAALRKELGLTGDQIHNIARSGITARQVIQALNQYIATTPGYMNAALRQSNKTLLGAFRQFQDILSRAAGTSEGGLFTGLTHMFAQVNYYLAPLMQNRKPITLYNVAQAFNNALSPSTNTVINTFVVLDNILRGIIWQFHMLTLILSYPLKLFGLLTGAGKSNEFVMMLVGRALSVLIFLWGLGKARLVALAIWTEINTIRALISLAVTKRMIIWEALLTLWRYRNVKALWAMIFAEQTQMIVAKEGYIAGWKQVFKYNGAVATMARFMTLTAIPVAVRFAFALKTLALSLTTAELAAFWPVALVAVFAILYWRVERFRNLVKDTVHWLTHPVNDHGILGALEKAARGAVTSLPNVGVFSAISLPGSSAPRNAAHTIPMHRLAMPNMKLGINVNPQPIYLDGRLIAASTAQVTTDYEARQ